jgi:hypothetical protein
MAAAVDAVVSRDQGREGRIDVQQLRACTRDGVNVTGGDVARELLCLLA